MVDVREALSDSERRVLYLLARGHTAKSIASTTGLSVHAVNERLRQARAKTGVGSSRELARRLRETETMGSQENWDKEIGVAPGARPDATLPSRAAPAWRGRPGWKGIAMILFVTGAVAALLLSHAGVPQDAETVAQLYAEDPSLAELHARVAGEPRDEAWAGRTEALIREQYAAIPGVGTAIDRLQVRCGASLCELTSGFAPQTETSSGQPAWAAVQDESVRGPLSAAGLREEVIGFSDHLFYIFWRRADASPPQVDRTTL